MNGLRLDESWAMQLTLMPCRASSQRHDLREPDLRLPWQRSRRELLADQAHDRGDVDDPARAALDHVAGDGLTGQKHPLEVGVQDLVPQILAQVS